MKQAVQNGLNTTSYLVVRRQRVNALSLRAGNGIKMNDISKKQYFPTFYAKITNKNKFWYYNWTLLTRSRRAVFKI